MPIPYEVQIIDHSGRAAARFEPNQWDTLEYDEVYNDIGTFALGFVGDQALFVQDTFKLPDTIDYFVDIWRYDELRQRRERVKSFVYLYLEEGVDDDGVPFAIMGGYDLNVLFDFRMIDPASDPDSVGGYVTLSGAASDMIARIVRYSFAGDAGIRDFPLVSVSVDGTGTPVGGDYRYDELLPALQVLALDGGVQFSIVHLGRRNLEVRIGKVFEDRTVETNYPGRAYLLVSRQRGNMVNPVIIHDWREWRNHAYARVSGNGSNEIVVEQSHELVSNSPFARREFAMTVGRNDDDYDPIAIVTTVRAELRSRLPVAQFEFALDDLLNSRYRHDWDLGWLLTGEYRGRRNTVRVVGLEVSVDEEGELIAPILERADL